MALVRRAREIVGGEVALVMGGFHLGGVGRWQINRIIDDFHDLGVRQVAPCHCTGDQAKRVFAEEYEDDFIRVGVGRVITVDVKGPVEVEDAYQV